jgi:hypothetical protein
VEVFIFVEELVLSGRLFGCGMDVAPEEHPAVTPEELAHIQAERDNWFLNTRDGTCAAISACLGFDNFLHLMGL